MFLKDPRSTVIYAHTKEIRVRNALNERFPEEFVHDTTLYTGGCNCTHRRLFILLGSFLRLHSLSLLCAEGVEPSAIISAMALARKTATGAPLTGNCSRRYPSKEVFLLDLYK